MDKKKIILLGAVLGLSLATVGVVWAQTGGGYDLTWWTVDGGGGAASGGSYTLTGTAGQPDAGTVSGGGYTLYSGFWAGGGGGSACVPLTGVGLAGPSSGNTGETLTFTASPTPTNATTPVTYTWSTDGLVSANGNQATYSWSVAGTHAVTVTARNCGGQDFNDSVQVSISPAGTCSVPLTGVGLAGPSSGNTGETLTFTASPTPTNATTPVTYTWSTDGLVSANGNQATYRWNDAGNKTVQVTARNCGGQDFSDSVQVNITAACTAVTGANINGLTSGYTNVQYEFVGSYEPSGATAPLTYTWSPTPLSGQGTLTATYRWTTTGTKTINFRVQNCGGTVTATHDISISKPPTSCEAITGVTLAGPTSGEPNTTYAFTATVQPANASTPINYTWSSDGLVSGQGTSHATYRWSQAGSYQVTVVAGNCGGTANDALSISIGRYLYLPLVVRNH